MTRSKCGDCVSSFVQCFHRSLPYYISENTWESGSTSELQQVFSLQLLKGISCNKLKVALSPTGFQGLLRVVKMSEPLQKVFK